MFEPAIDQASEPAETVGHARRTHTAATRRSLVPLHGSVYGTLFDRALRWLVPWERREYPGLVFGSEHLLPYLSVHTIRQVRRGYRDLPPYAAADLAAIIRAEIDRGLALEAELLARAAEPYRAHLGFREVKDWGNGVIGDKRNRGKKA